MRLTPKQAVFGCLIGCGSLVLVVVVLSVSFGVWVTRPGELLEPEQLLGEDTTGYVEWTLRLEDPGTEGFVRQMIEAIQRLQQRNDQVLPPVLQGWLASYRDGKTARDIEQLFPVAVAWTLRPDLTGEGDLHLLTVSLRSAGNRLVFADWILGLVLSRTDEADVHSHQGEKIYRLGQRHDNPFTFFIRGNDLFFVSDLDTAKQAITRLEGAEAGTPRETTRLERLYARTPEQRPLRGAISNDRGEIARLWEATETAAPRADWDGLEGLFVEGSLAADGALEGTLELIGVEAERQGGEVGSWAPALRAWLDRAPFEIETTATPSPDGVRIDIRIPDLARELSDAMRAID